MKKVVDAFSFPMRCLALIGLAAILSVFYWQILIIVAWLIVCYLVVAPVFRENDATIDVASFFVATCLGVMLSGFLYVISIILGFPSIWSVLILFVSIALINTVRYQVSVVLLNS